MSAGRQVWLNDGLVEERSATISIFDRGFLFGDGVYEVIRYTRADPATGRRRFGVGLDLHVERLRRSLELARITGFDADSLPRICEATLEANDLFDATVYVQITRGAGTARTHLPGEGLRPTVLAIATSAEPIEGLAHPLSVRAITIEDPRWRLCRIKTTSLMGAVLAVMEADDRGASEAILHRDDLVGEGASSNVFIVRDGSVATPPVDDEPPILHGVTRAELIATGERIGLPVAVRPIPLEELRAAEEIFLASTRRLVGAVLSLDGRAVGGGEAGPVTRTLFSALRDEIVRCAGARAAIPA